MTNDPGVAAVCIEQPLPHLDRLFDYRIPDTLLGQVRPGCRVRVTFAGRLVSGYVIALKDHSDFTGTLTTIKRLITAEPIVSEEFLQVATSIAQRYAGTLSDVLRLAVPPRRASVEKEPWPQPASAPAMPPFDAWSRYHSGEAFIRAIGQSKSPRVVWEALPGEEWPQRLAEAATACAYRGQGAVLVVPDQTDLDRLVAALQETLGEERFVSLSATLGPTKRYRAYLRAQRGGVQVVAGTRAAMFAPVANLGLVAIWDDGDEVHSEPHAPYPHAREVLLTRATRAGAACIVGGFARTANAQLLVDAGFAVSITGTRDAKRESTPRVVPVGDPDDVERDPAAHAARLPSVAWQAAREALRQDLPVLVQVPRRGYLPVVSCQRCRQRCLCPRCEGPLQLPGSRGTPRCSWCGESARDFQCPECGSSRLRAGVIGQERTGEELSQAFPQAPVIFSSGAERRTRLPAEPAVVVATPGAEPAIDGGYGAVLLLDTWALLNRASLTAGEEAVRRWMAAATLSRAAADGGVVVVVANGGLPVVQALMRWDSAWFAAKELQQRTELRFPPMSRMASATGRAADLDEFSRQLQSVPQLNQVQLEELGPVEVDSENERLLFRVERRHASALAQALGALVRQRSESKAPKVRVQVDPRDLF